MYMCVDKSSTVQYVRTLTSHFQGYKNRGPPLTLRNDMSEEMGKENAAHLAVSLA